MPGHRVTLPPIPETKISPEALKALAAIPDSKCGKARAWTKLQDEILLAGWTTKNQRELCRVIGCAVNTARDRYKELTRGQP